MVSSVSLVLPNLSEENRLDAVREFSDEESEEDKEICFKKIPYLLYSTQGYEYLEKVHIF